MASRVLFVIGSLEVGGTERHLASLAGALQRRAWDVAVYSLRGAGPLGQEIEAQGAAVVEHPFRRSIDSPSLTSAQRLAVMVHLLRTTRRIRPAIVHFFLPAAYLIGAPLAALARVPIRVMSRRSLNAYQSPPTAVLERWLHRRMTAVLGNSRAVIRELVREGVPRERVGLIYNGLDLTRFAGAGARIATRLSLGVAPDALILVIVANLIPYKGHIDLLHALASAQPHLPAGWRLLVVGRDDGFGFEIRTKAIDLALDQSVLFVGSRDDIPELLQAADIGVLCSHQEGFSNAVLEGMAAGLPMIVTDVGGNAEAVLDGRTGFVVPARDPARLAEAILRVAGNPALRARLGRAGRCRVAEHFTLDACVARYDALYRTLLAGGMPQDVSGVALPCAELPV